MNKKAQNLFPLVFFALVIILFIGAALIIGLGSGILTFTMDTFTTSTDNLGSITTNTNLTEYHGYTIDKVNEVVQMAKWGSGILIAFALLGLLMMAAAIRLRPSGFLIGLYFLLVLVLIITAIYISNMYQDFHDGSDDIALELQSMPLTSFLILHLPIFITVIAFIGGVIMFTGVGEEFV